MKDNQGASAVADRATAASQSNPQAVSSIAGIPSAEWPCWAAVTTHEEFRGGSLVSVTGFRWLFAPSETDAHFGARKWFRETNPDARNLEVFVREVPAQAIEARRAETGTGSVHESAVGTADAPETPHDGGPHD